MLGKLLRPIVGRLIASWRHDSGCCRECGGALPPGDERAIFCLDCHLELGAAP